VRCRGFGTVVLVIASVMATGIFTPAIDAADNRGYVFDNGSLYPSLNYTRDNGLLPNASIQQEHGTTPAPVTIYRFELNQTSLPGPRYMAYGPSTIALAFDPLIIAFLIAIGAIITGVWYLYPRNGKDEKDE
jgi:hypothetical protein